MSEANVLAELCMKVRYCPLFHSSLTSTCINRAHLVTY
jgi:hypothetical protein